MSMKINPDTWRGDNFEMSVVCGLIDIPARFDLLDAADRHVCLCYDISGCYIHQWRNVL